MVTTPRTEQQANDALALRPAEVGVLREVTAEFAEQLRDSVAREQYGELFGAVAAGSVPPDLIGSLEAMLELVLQTPRILTGYGVEERHALSRVFGRTPRGATLREAVQEVNAALAVLAGQTMEQMRFSTTPGGYGIEIITDHCRISLAADRTGVRVERLELAG